MGGPTKINLQEIFYATGVCEESCPSTTAYFLTTTTSATVIHTLKAIFSRHGIPAVLMSDNDPQYSSHKMKDFANQYNFKHVTSSPHYPQSNGTAEHMVRTAKSLLEKSADPYLALLTYRTTPLP